MRLGILVAALVITLTGPLASPATATFPGTNGLIAFTSDRDGDEEVYSMNPDGSDQRNLTNHPARDNSPGVSPDAQRIAFTSTRDDPTNPNATGEIYVMDADGLNQTRLTNHPGYDLGPQFSPDGQRIVFMSSRVGPYLQIWVMNADGSNPVQLTTDANGESTNPTFSPDGRKIAFESERDGGQDEIYVMNADGTGQTRLTNNTASDTQASFSPDGQRIAFESTRDSATGGGPYEIYAMNADGTGQTRLTTNPAGDTEAAFSPDGTRILFESNRSGNYELWLMDTNGANPTQLTDNPAVDAGADWAPCPVAGGCGASPVSSVSLTDSQYGVLESAGRIDVAVRRSNALNQPVTVAYATTPGSATAGSDYTPTSGTVSFAAGQTEKTFSVSVTNDSVDEADETFGVALSDPSTGAQLTSPSSATVTIVDDDSPPPGPGTGPGPGSPVPGGGSGPRPDTSITTGPTGSTWVDQPQFGFGSSTPGVTFRCRVDGHVYVPCTSPYTAPRLTPGDHTFSVYAVGPDGVADPTPATISFRVHGAETRRASCEVSPFQAIDNGNGTGDRKTTCEIYFGDRPGCQAYEVCEYRPDDACPVGAICTLQTAATWSQVQRRYLAVTYANSRLEQARPPLTVSGRFSQSCRTVTDCSVSDTQQAMGRAPMVSTCSALVTVPDGPGYIELPPRYRGSASTAAASLKLGCRATLKIRPAPAYTLYPTGGRLVAFVPMAGRVTIAPLTGKSSVAQTKRKKKRTSAPVFRTIAVNASTAGPIAPTLRLGKAAARTLKRKGRLRVRARLTFTPKAGGARVIRTQTLTLRRQPVRPRRCVRHEKRKGRPKVCVPRTLR